jgi:hypothetical protein
LGFFARFGDFRSAIDHDMKVAPLLSLFKDHIPQLEIFDFPELEKKRQMSVGQPVKQADFPQEIFVNDLFSGRHSASQECPISDCYFDL